MLNCVFKSLVSLGYVINIWSPKFEDDNSFYDVTKVFFFSFKSFIIYILVVCVYIYTYIYIYIERERERQRERGREGERESTRILKSADL